MRIRQEVGDTQEIKLNSSLKLTDFCMWVITFHKVWKLKVTLQRESIELGSSITVRNVIWNWEMLHRMYW